MLETVNSLFLLFLRLSLSEALVFLISIFLTLNVRSGYLSQTLEMITLSHVSKAKP